jgi:hypothetical protein
VSHGGGSFGLAQEVTWACRRTTAPKLLPHVSGLSRLGPVAAYYY